ncbi:MAG: ABC transporter permease, partial [Spirochaetales bacterium]|nr:ABC transporter permease [Spirochaetales bacterium]
MIYHSRAFFLAIKFFTGKNKLLNNKNLLGAVLGIGLALVPLIVVLEISSGMIEGITRRYMEIGSYHLQLRQYNQTDQEIEENNIKKIKTIPGIRAVFPVAAGLGLAYSENGRTGISFKALPADYMSIDTAAKEYIKIEYGEFDLDSKDSAMLSAEVARILEVVPGDRIKILTARQTPGRRPVLKPSYLTVKGIFSTGYYELDSLSIYINIEKGKTLFRDQGSFFIAVKIDDPFEDIEEMESNIKKQLNANYSISTWYDLERNMIDSFNTTKTILLFIMIIIVLVAAMNISSAIVMLVMEKESEIAMLKSTGVGSSLITKAFVYIGFIIGLAGTLTGLLAGLMIAVNINEVIRGSELLINIAYGIIKTIISPFFTLGDKTLV